jgi:hypothetical protein
MNRSDLTHEVAGPLLLFEPTASTYVDAGFSVARDASTSALVITESPKRIDP